MMGKKKLVGGFFVILLMISVSAYNGNAGSDLPAASIYNSQELAQLNPVPGWEQVNSNGFGNPMEQEVSALEVFNGSLYAGTYNLIDPLQVYDGARIFRSPDGVMWTAVTEPGFQNPHDTAPPAILDFVVFNTRLYASTGRGGNAAQIWRSATGGTWAPMVNAGFGDPDLHDIAALAVFNNMIYAGAGSQVSGAKLYRSSSGDSNTWSLLTPAAASMAGAGVTGFEVFNSTLYATIESEAPMQVWRSSNGSTWTVAVSNGFGDSQTTSTGGMAVFGGYLYIGAGNSEVGAQLWRTPDGANWEQAIPPGFGDANNQTVEMVFVFRNQLYASTKNPVTGMELWRSTNGAQWERASLDGFGDSHNTSSNGSHAAANFLNGLYLGTSNVMDGGELWRYKTDLLTVRSTAAYDGWILESSGTSNKGGSLNSAAPTFYLGDDAQDKQYRSILSFSTRGLPDNAAITKVLLKLKKHGITGGGDPVNLFRGFMIDIKQGYFGPVAGLQASDFQASADKSIGPFKPALKNGWYTLNLTPAKAFINMLATGGGVTQLRLRFKLDDNNNTIANCLRLGSGNASTASRPKLVIEYYVP